MKGEDYSSMFPFYWNNIFRSCGEEEVHGTMDKRVRLDIGTTSFS